MPRNLSQWLPVWTAGGVFAATLAFYLMTMPRSITLEDAGLFQMICHEGGIGHPPGYPLFILSCQAFVSLPWFDQGVFAANLLSALYASTACVVLFLLVNSWLQRSDVAILAALLYGFSATFWSQAIIVEVYSLSVLLSVLCLWFCVLFVKSENPRWLVALALVYGLGLANHWPQLGLATPAMLLLLWQVRSTFFSILLSRWFIACLLALAAGLMPYLTLFQANPPFAVYGPVDSWMDFARYVSRAAYDDQFPLADWSDKALFQQWVALQTLREFSFVLAPLTILGFYRSFFTLGRTEAWSLVLLYLGGTTLLVLLLGFEFSDIRIAIFEPYPVVAYIAPAIWTALGARWATGLLRSQSELIARALPLVIVTVVLLSNVSSNNRRSNQFAEIYGLEVLSLVPEDAVLFVEGDNGVGLIGYLHFVEGLRSDIELRSWNNLVFSNRLVSPFLPVAQQQRVRQEFIDSQSRPVLSTVSPHRKGLRAGIVIQHNLPHGYVFPDGAHEFVEYLLSITGTKPLANGHERDLLGSLLLEYTRLYVGMLTTHGELDTEELRTLGLLQETFFGKIGTVETLLQLPSDKANELGYGKADLQQLMIEAEAMLPAYPDRALRGVVAEFHGRVALLEPADNKAAIVHLKSSIAQFPSEENGSLCVLVNTYRKVDDEQSAVALVEKWGSDTCG